MNENETYWSIDSRGSAGKMYYGFMVSANNSGYWSVAIRGNQLARGKEDDQGKAKIAAINWVDSYANGNDPKSPLLID